MPKLTLLDIAKRKGNDSVVGMIEEIGTTAPEVAMLDTRTITGTSYSTYIRKGVPRVGFRPPNAPATFVSCLYEKRNVELFNISTLVAVDKAVLNADEKGPAAVLADETIGVGQGVLLSIGAQNFYGKLIDKEGYYGLNEMIDDSMIISANPALAESAPSSNKGTSVYAIIEGPTAIQMVYGNGQTIGLSAFTDQLIPKQKPDGTLGLIPCKASDMNCWVAITNNSKLTAARLKNIDVSKGATTAKLNDELIADLLALFPAGYKVTALLMNSKARLQLQKSRPVVAAAVNGGNAGGGSSGFAPIPVESNGVPIWCTDSIVSDESDLSGITGITHWGKFANQ